MTDHGIDPRHARRMELVQAAFAHSFNDLIGEEKIKDSGAALNEDLDPVVKKILAQQVEFDQQISQVAPERPLTEINRIDLAILRVILYEAKHKDTPKKVLINEAVVLAKEFGTESSPKFVNGVLGKLLISDKHDTE